MPTWLQIIIQLIEALLPVISKDLPSAGILGLSEEDKQKIEEYEKIKAVLTILKGSSK